ncbi:MAG: hypothetical protein ABIR24_09690 [Verrucomicrobiota bacterium]
MSNDIPSSRVSPQETSAISPLVLPLTEVGKSTGQWTLTLHPSHLALADAPGAQPYIILREQMMKSAILMEGMRTLLIKQPRKINFKLSPESTAALADWIGKSVIAAQYLKQRYAFMLPVAVIWIIGSLPISRSSSGSADALPFDPIGFCLGSTLVITWAWAKWRPNPTLFLVDSIWFLALAVSLVVDVVNGRSKGWLVLVAFMLWLVVSGIKHFRRFRGTSIASQRNK